MFIIPWRRWVGAASGTHGGGDCAGAEVAGIGRGADDADSGGQDFEVIVDYAHAWMR